MSGAVVAIVSAFFIIGITVGVIAVVALSVLRSRRPGDSSADHHPRWPDDTDSDFSGR